MPASPTFRGAFVVFLFGEYTPSQMRLARLYLSAMKTLILSSLLVSASLVSCSNSPRARTGTVIGALGGAGVGGIIGSQSGRGLEGAAIGAGLGALGGNLIGGANDGHNNRDGYRRY